MAFTKEEYNLLDEALSVMTELIVVEAINTEISGYIIVATKDDSKRRLGRRAYGRIDIKIVKKQDLIKLVREYHEEEDEWRGHNLDLSDAIAESGLLW